MPLARIIKSNPALKKLVHWCLIPKYQARPRRWVTIFVNPFYHTMGKCVNICRRTRMDILPFHSFSVGDYTTIEDFSTINNGVGGVQIGRNTRVGMSNVIIGPVTIGNNVIMAQNIVISALNHNYKNIEIPISLQGETVIPIIIEDDCWIGANVVITAGITIGKHCVIGAGTVVTKNIPAFCVAVGNPARVIKKYNSDTKTWDEV